MNPITQRGAKSHVVQFEITGRDATRLHDFYGGLFGWDLRVTPGGATSSYRRTSASETGLPGAVGPVRSGPNVGRDPGEDAGGGQVTVYVEVEDIESAVSNAVQLGGKVVAPVYEVPGKHLRLAFIADPEGHVVGLSQGLQNAIDRAGYSK